MQACMCYPLTTMRTSLNISSGGHVSVVKQHNFYDMLLPADMRASACSAGAAEGISHVKARPEIGAKEN